VTLQRKCRPFFHYLAPSKKGPSYISGVRIVKRLLFAKAVDTLKTQAVQSRFATGNTHLRLLKRSLSGSRLSLVTQCGRAFGHLPGLPSHIGRLDGLHACERPFYPFRQNPCGSTLVGLAWEGSPVASQYSYGGVMRRYLYPVEWKVFTVGWVLSPTLCAANFGQHSRKQKAFRF
jgi:hypothetical protein